VAYENGVFHMFLFDYTDAQVERWTSNDGITYTFQEMVIQLTPGYHSVQYIWFDPHDNLWYLYHTNRTAALYQACVRNASSLEAFSTAPETILNLGGTSVWGMMHWHDQYWFVGELLVSGNWVVRGFTSEYPDKNLVECTNSPILTDYEACPRLGVSENGSKAYIFSQRTSSWYSDTRAIYGANFTYDIYFGTSTTPPQVASNQTNDFYNPGLLDYDTTYYWMVVSWSSEGIQSASPLWSFTTELANNPPAISNEYPINGSTSITLQPRCQIDIADSDSDPCTVYWYNSTDGTTFTHQQTNTSVASGNTVYWEYIQADAYETTYYWKVAVNDSTYNISAVYHFTTQSAPMPWWDPDWNNRMLLTIDSSEIDSPLTNFPILVALNSSTFDFSNAQTHGEDIRFTDYNNLIVYDYEIERWNTTVDMAEIWVNIPQISATEDTMFWMYYNNTAASDNQQPTSVWNSNYMMVQHLSETSGTHYDSTANNNDGTPYNEVTQNAVGEIDGADSFDGLNDYIAVSDSSTIEIEAPATIAFWFNSTQSGATTILIEKDGSPGFSIQKEATTDKMKINVGNVEALQTIATYNDGVWHHITYVLNETTALSKVYVDGIDDTDGTPAYSSPTYGTGSLYIGSRASNYPYGGFLDEIRISDTAYNGAWITASYYAESNTLLVYGSEETLTSDAPVLFNEVPEDHATDVKLNPTLSIDASDLQGNTMNISFLTNASGIWQQIGSTKTGGDQTYTQATAMFTTHEKKYWWSVHATDPTYLGGSGNWTNRTYSFTTKPAILVSNPDPLHNALDIPLQPTLSIQVNHTEGDTMTTTWMTNASTGTWHTIGTNTSANDTIHCYNTGEMNQHSTTYWWLVNVTDTTGNLKNITYQFTTIAPPIPPNEPSNPRPADTATDVPISINLSWDCSDPTYPEGGDFFDLSPLWTTISGNPTNTHGLEPVRKTRIVPVNKMIDGEVRKYVGYDSNAGGSQIRLYYTDDVDGQWTPYSGNPILSTGTVRCPTTTYDNGTFHMFIYAGSKVDRWTSTDGINYVYQELVANTGGIANSCIWFNPNDQKWYFYHTEWTGGKWAAVRNATNIEDLDTAPMTKNNLNGVTIWSTMYWHEKYWFVGELSVGGIWTVRAFYSDYPDRNIVLCDNAPILTNYEACPRLCVMENGSRAYIFSNRHSSWYQDTREIYGANLTYDVYFGTSPTPSQIASNQSGDLYNPGSLNYDTTYYWKIVAWSSTGAKNESPVWSFTTEPFIINHPPEISNVYPENGSINVEMQPQCQIKVTDADANTSTVYWYNSSDGITFTLQQTNTSVSSGDTVYWNYSQATEHDTTYYWKVAVNDSIDNTTAIYHFTTHPEPQDWIYYRKITIDHNYIEENLTNFPILLQIPSDIGLSNHTQPTGNDIRFYNEDNSTQYHHEIESYNYSSGALNAWINVTQLSSTPDTIIWMSYGNTICSSQENITGTWDSHYIMIQHLNEETDIHYDSTVNDNDGTWHDSNGQGSQDATGLIDGANEFDGVDDDINCGGNSVLDITGTITIEAWIKKEASTNYAGIVEKGNGGFAAGYLLREWSSGNIQFQIYKVGGGTARATTSGGISTGAWHYVVGVYDKTRVSLYVDTTKTEGDSYTGDLIISADDLLIGYDTADTARHFDGVIDEIRISDTVRNASWISTSYNNQNDPSSFFSLGSEEFSGILPEQPILSNEYPVNGSASVELNPTLSIDVIDHQGDTMDISFFTNASTTWEQIGTTQTGGNDTYTQSTSMFTDYGTTYWWSVNCTDGNGHWTNDTYPFTTEPAQVLWWNTNWENRMLLTINSSKVDSTLINFPVLVSLDNSNFDFSKAQTHGEDIRFTDYDNLVEYYYEIERWNSTTDMAEVWVNITSVSAIEDTQFWMYYNNPVATDNQQPTNMWNADYMMVHHLNETSGTHYDSTSNNNDGTPYNEVTQDALGKIDGGDSFDGSNDYISVADSSIIEIEAPATIAFWFNSTQSGATTILIEKDGSPGFSVQKEGTTNKMKINVGNVEALQTVDTYNDGEWHYIAYVLDETTSLSKVYVDGIDDTDGTPAYSSPTYGTDVLYIGGRASSLSYGGLLDEIRISDTAYSSAWIKATYSTENNSLLSYGSEETLPGQAPQLANEIPEDDSINIDLNPTLSIDASDLQADTMNISFYTNASGVWLQIGTTQTGGNDTYTQSTSTFTDYVTTYWWSVNATDPTYLGGSGNWTNRTYSFTTKPAILVSNPDPPHNALDVSLQPTLSVQVNHTDGDTMTITWMTNASTGTWHAIDTNVSGNGTVYCSNTLKMNQYSTMYWWSVNVTDTSGNWKNITYRFTTIEPPIPPNEPSNPRPADNTTNVNRSINLSWDCSDPTYPENGDFFDLSPRWTTISGNPTNRHGFEPVRKTRIVPANKMIDGAVRKYIGYDSDAGGSQIRLYYTDDLDGQWTQYSGNPILSTGTVRCPTTTYHNGTFHMFIYAGSKVDRWTSSDGITYTYQEKVADTGGIANSCIWFNPNDERWYFYHTEWTGGKWAAVRNASSIEDLDSAPMTKNNLGGVTIWSTMYWHEKYWFVGELFDGGTWTVRAFYSDYPDKNMVLCDNAPILTDYEACPRLCVMENGSRAYIFSSRGGSWYQDTREIFGANLTYDVYFGTSPTPPKVASNQSGDIYNPGVLDYDTEYYWRVVAWNPAGEKNESLLWNFTTVPFLVNHPPVISGVYPPNGSTGVELQPICHITVTDADLNETTVYWYNSSDGTTFSLQQVNSSVSSGETVYWNYSQANEYDTLYYWKVAVNDSIDNTTAIYHFTTESAPVSWWNANWNYRMLLTVNSSKVDADLTNFPILIKLNSSVFDFTKAQAHGEDIRFTDYDNLVEYFYEIERWNATSSEAEIWVNITSVSASSDTLFWMYYNNSAASDNQHPFDVWSSHYLMVQHLNETSGTHYDSTVNNNDGTPYNEVTQNTVGEIDGADSFDGSDDYIEIPDSSSLEIHAPATISFWFNTTQTGNKVIFEKNENNGFSVQRRGTNHMKINYGGISDAIMTTGASYHDGLWHHIVFVLESTWSQSKIYVDGVDDTGTINTPGTPTYGSETIYIGSRASVASFGGTLDEIRVTDTAYSNDQIKATYYSEDNALLSFGIEETH